MGQPNESELPLTVARDTPVIDDDIIHIRFNMESLKRLVHYSCSGISFALFIAGFVIMLVGVSRPNRILHDTDEAVQASKLEFAHHSSNVLVIVASVLMPFFGLVLVLVPPFASMRRPLDLPQLLGIIILMLYTIVLMCCYFSVYHSYTDTRLELYELITKCAPT